jgi:hypothetical protein
MKLLLTQGPEKDLTTLGLKYATFPRISTKGCFQDLTHDLV